MLIVFARAPAIGVGKSRLARDVGAVEAWRVYRAMREGLLRRLADPRWRLVVRVTPDGAVRRTGAASAEGATGWDSLPPRGGKGGDGGARATMRQKALEAEQTSGPASSSELPTGSANTLHPALLTSSEEGEEGDPFFEPQGPGGLGVRLARALRAHGRFGVAVVGTDCPEVTPERVWRALRAARRAGAALGPAEDGGFWILALAPGRARRLSLDGVRWSSAHAFADTLAALGGEAAVLETLADVDDGEGLRAWRRRRSAARRG